MRALLLPLALVAACSSTSSKARVGTDGPSTPLPEPPSAVLDEGSYKITLAGAPVGEESFKIASAPEGARRMTARAVWHLGGQEAKIDSDVTVDVGFRPTTGAIKYVVGENTTDMTLAVVDGVLQLASPAAKEPYKEKLTSHIFIHDRVLSHWSPTCSIGGGDGGEILVFPGLRFVISPPRKLDGDGEHPGLVRHEVNAETGAFFTVVCDGAKLIMVTQPTSRLIAARVGYEAAAALVAKADDWKIAIPAGLQEVERQVRTADGTVLGCSLVTPAERRGTLASVVLLTGSGAQDRDEDSPGGRPVGLGFLKRLAIVLAQGGVASLRCDDRGVGKSDGDGNKITLDTLVADARAQVAQLRAEPGLDPMRVGVAGHSEGGLVATKVAAEDRNVKAVALLASMGRTLDVLSMEQREKAMKDMGVPPDEIAREQKRFGRVYAAIKAGKPLPEDTPEDEKRSILPLVPYFASHFRHDPQTTLRAVKVPVLVARGDQDIQVALEDVKVITDGLKRGGNKAVVVKTYPGLSHMFARTKTGTIADYSDRSLPVDGAFLQDVAGFFGNAL